MNRRFTIDGSIQLENQLDHLCAEVREGIRVLIPPRKLQAIFLGGGYGRGEGGVLRTAEGDRPYNDMEFYICLQGNPRLNEKSFGRQLHAFGEELSQGAELEVEFKITSLEQLQKSRPSMFLYDLALGHKTVFGNDAVLQEARFRNAGKIPLHEATRLLMNRCSGLLFSEEKLMHHPFTAEDADFIGRNHAKAQLAFGDVVLTVLGQYHWSCIERNRRLQNLGNDISLSGLPVSLNKIICHHGTGVEFKLHPQRTNGSAEEFLPLQAELREIGRDLWLWLENRRLHQRFSSIQEYALSSIDKCPETNPIKNRLINLKQFGLSGCLGTRGCRYPRERLLNSLALLMWNSTAGDNGVHLSKVQDELNTVSTHFTELVSAYCSVWRNFN